MNLSCIRTHTSFLLHIFLNKRSSDWAVQVSTLRECQLHILRYCGPPAGWIHSLLLAILYRPAPPPTPTPSAKTGFLELESRSEPLEEPATSEANNRPRITMFHQIIQTCCWFSLTNTDPGFHDFSQLHCYSKYQTLGGWNLRCDCHMVTAGWLQMDCSFQ
jgi:hypothetical protein